MKAKEIHRLSLELRKRYRIKQVDLQILQSIIREYGYTIIEFNAFENDEDTSLVIEKLDLSDMMICSKGFTYADSECRLVLVLKELEDREKILILSHELGHIICNHLEHAPVLGTSVTEEDEANQFAHYFLRPVFTDVLATNCRLYRKQLVVVFCILLALLGIIVHSFYNQKQASYYGNFYITENGKKYHKEGCMFVKNKDNVRRLKIEEFESGKYTPCQMCLPD